MKVLLNNLMLNVKKAYKESIVIDNDILQDILLDILTDTKKLQNNLEEPEVNTLKLSKKGYSYEEVKAITEIQIMLAKDLISIEVATRQIEKISQRFPVNHLVQYNKRMQGLLNGIGKYGFGIPSNWAKALLEVTNNDLMVIKALREQQRLYLDKDGRNNQNLENLLDEGNK